MNPVETKRAIAAAFSAFSAQPLAAAATGLFESLGYKSEKRLPLKPNTPDNFLATFGQGRKLNPDHASLAEWRSVDFLFQLTDDEVRAAAAGNQQFLFDSKGKYNGAAMESYLFFAITLAKQPTSVVRTIGTRSRESISKDLSCNPRASRGIQTSPRSPRRPRELFLGTPFLRLLGRF